MDQLSSVQYFLSSLESRLGLPSLHLNWLAKKLILIELISNNFLKREDPCFNHRDVTVWGKGLR
jgi:hypothetical protein